MYALTGKVVTKERLPSNYLSVIIQRQKDGLLGSRVQVLVPTLVEVRDGAPHVGSVVALEARPPRADDLAAGLTGFDFVVNRIALVTAGAAGSQQLSVVDTPPGEVLGAG